MDIEYNSNEDQQEEEFEIIATSIFSFKPRRITITRTTLLQSCNLDAARDCDQPGI